jgi:hypothetical protein
MTNPPEIGPDAPLDIRGAATASDPSGIRQFFAPRSAHNARSVSRLPESLRCRTTAQAGHPIFTSPSKRPDKTEESADLQFGSCPSQDRG